MPYEITLDNLPMGIAAESSPKHAATVRVQMRGYWSSDDGPAFTDRVEQFGNPMLKVIGKETLPPSCVDHLLAVIRRDRSATVYLNELPISIQARANRRINAGEPVFRDDIVDVSHLTLGVSIPEDAGFLFFFSCGWRRAILFDFEVLDQSVLRERKYDVPTVLGQTYGELMFQDFLRVTQTAWDTMLGQRWFPFRVLSSGTTKAIISHAKEGWEIDDMLDKIAEEALNQAARTLDGWRKRPVFAPHAEVLARAVDRYAAEDYMSCVCLIYPRIEGLMRSFCLMSGNIPPFKHKALVNAVVPDRPSPFGGEGPLLPSRFREYVQNVILASFDPTHHNNEVTRHSVAHGTSDSTRYDKKAATIGLLTLLQLTYYFIESGHVHD